MKRLLVLTEVYEPENFNVNPLVREFSRTHSVTVVTRSPSYPYGTSFPGFHNSFSSKVENGIKVIRYPIFLNYNKFLAAKVGNLFWQPFVTFLITCFLSWDKVFVYQTGSLYTYAFFPFLSFRRKNSVIWSQDLWPEAGYEFGLPKFWLLDRLLAFTSAKILRSFKTVLVQSNDFRDHYALNYGVQSTVIHNFVDFQKLPHYANRTDSGDLVYAGNIGSVQNVRKLLELFLNLRDAVPEIQRLHVYGHGSLFDSVVGDYLNENDIIFHGRVSQNEVKQALSTCRYAIFSLKQGPLQKTLPSRLQFFYNLNVPVIYLGQGAAARFIKQNTCGVVIESMEYTPDMLLKSIRNFERLPFSTGDLFNKDRIINSIIASLQSL